MELTDVIESRRAYRALVQVLMTKTIVEELASAARLAPSCFNNQPWRYVFAYDEEALKATKAALSKGNAWAQDASMIIVVFSRKEDDCVIKERLFHHFDTGMATAFLILRATEMGLVAHPIAGFDEKKMKQAVGIPEDVQVLTVVVVAKHSDTMTPNMSEDQKKTEVKRPERKRLEEFAFHNRYTAPQQPPAAPK